MKKLLLLVVMLIAISTFSQGTLNKGAIQFNGGVGFSNWGIPLSLGLDYGIGNRITLGAEFTYRVDRGNSGYGGYYTGYYYDYDYNYYSNYRQPIIGISTNGNYHFNELIKVIPKNVDLYAGVNLGYYIRTNKYDNYYDNSSGLGVGLQTGGRYFFNNNLGVNAEFTGGRLINGGLFGAKAGVTYRFGNGKSNSKKASTSSKKTSSSNVADSSKETVKKTETKTTKTTSASKTSTKTSTKKTTTKKKVATKKK